MAELDLCVIIELSDNDMVILTVAKTLKREASGRVR